MDARSHKCHLLAIFLIVTAGCVHDSFARAAPSDWRINKARVRFQFSVAGRPGEASAGIIVIIPDGGILPRGHATATVFDSAGNALKHRGLWHNPQRGLALVIEPPTAGNSITVYMSPGARSYPGPPRALKDFTPGPLFYGARGVATLDRARSLATTAPVGEGIEFAPVRRVFERDPPSGHAGRNATYYTAWFRCRKPGRTYFYTVSQDGSEIRVDGKLVHSWPGVHDRREGAGATQGAWIDLSKGLHRIEYTQFNVAAREVHLGWQVAGAAQPYQVLKDAAGVPHVSRFLNRSITGPMQPGDFVQSGRATLVKAESPTGPLAVFEPRWVSYMQPYGNMICRYEFKPALTGTHPEGTEYGWQFENGAGVAASTATRLYAGRGDRAVALTLKHGEHRSTAQRRFFPKSLPRRASILNARDRVDYRRLFLEDAKSESGRSAEHWPETKWAVLRCISEIGKGQTLIVYLFTKSYEDLRQLDTQLRWYFEELFIDAARRHLDPGKVAEWINRLESAERDKSRKLFWKLQAVEYLMIERREFKAAALRLGTLEGMHQPKEAEWLRAIVRLGDLAFLQGEVSEARRRYGWVASRPKKGLATARAQPLSRLWTTSKEPAPPVAGEKRSALRERFERSRTTASDWRATAVREGTHYKTFRKLLDDGFVEEARAVLEWWEIELPLSKFEGEYTVAEAEYLMEVGRHRQAQQFLEAFRRAVDMSAFLPRAMELEMRCLIELKQMDEFRELAQAVVDDFSGFPQATTAENLLRRYGRP